ncbi:MAG: helix-turn-helix domain-containing protein [Lachnospiraceae bacterium]
MSKNEIIIPTPQLPVYFDICHTKSHIVPSHWHTQLEIIYILKGSMEIICGENKYSLLPGDLFAVNPGDIHYTRSIGDTDLILLQIPYEILENSIEHLKEIRFRPYFSKLKISCDTYMKSMESYLLSMKKLYLEKKEGYQLIFTGELYLFLHLLYTCFSKRCETFAEDIRNTSSHKMKMILSYIEKHYAEKISLDEISQVSGLNTQYFCRYFKKNMGFTFIQYLNTVRLSHICRDLLYTDDTVTQIQLRHGFTNYKLFNRMFKEAYGCTPSQMRQRNP